MKTQLRSMSRVGWVATRAIAVFTLVLGIGYTAVITGVGQMMFPEQANGSRVSDSAGSTVGSSLLGQSFTDTAGRPLRQYFQPRPSAAGDGYDAGLSSGSNLGPENPALVQEIRTRREQIAAFNSVAESVVPADAVTSSGSGLDPDISPAYALIQVDRVAAARDVTASRLRSLVESQTHGREFGYLGEPHINVVELNLALDALG